MHHRDDISSAVAVPIPRGLPRARSIPVVHPPGAGLVPGDPVTTACPVPGLATVVAVRPSGRVLVLITGPIGPAAHRRITGLAWLRPSELVGIDRP